MPAGRLMLQCRRRAVAHYRRETGIYRTRPADRVGHVTCLDNTSDKCISVVRIEEASRIMVPFRGCLFGPCHVNFVQFETQITACHAFQVFGASGGWFL